MNFGDVMPNDLKRVGNLKIDYDFFETRNNLEFDSICYDFLSPKKKYNILNIGDSFSRQELSKVNGYVNYLCKKYVLFNMLFSVNPVNRLKELIRNNYLDTLGVKHIILQSSQRVIIPRLLNDHIDTQITNFKRLAFLDSLKHQYLLKGIEESKYPVGFFSRTSLFYGLNYLIKKDINKKVLRFKTRNKLFSFNKKELLVSNEDIYALKYHNSSKIQDANNELNKIALQLKTKNIRLFVLIIPDKYDFYFDNILNSPFGSPNFYNVLDSLPKDYIYINSKEILNNCPNKDLYFFDDTHWSPIASKVVAEKIENLIKN